MANRLTSKTVAPLKGEAGSGARGRRSPRKGELFRTPKPPRAKIVAGGPEVISPAMNRNAGRTPGVPEWEY